MSAWDIKIYDTDKNKLEQTQGMQLDVIPKFPSMSLFVGKSGSGKSNLLMNMCLNEHLLGDFFDHIYFISPTGEIDDLVKHLKLPKDHVWTDLKQSVKDLEILLDNQAFAIEKHGISKASEKNKVLVICDDCVGDKHFMKSDILVKLAIHGRHNLTSSIILSQSYTKVPRAIRLQAQGLAIFPSSQDEIKLLTEDYCPPNRSKQQFNSIIQYATNKPYQFLFINNHCSDMNEKFRKGLGEIIDLKTRF